MKSPSMRSNASEFDAITNSLADERTWLVAAGWIIAKYLFQALRYRRADASVLACEIWLRTDYCRMRPKVA